MEKTGKLGAIGMHANLLGGPAGFDCPNFIRIFLTVKLQAPGRSAAPMG